MSSASTSASDIYADVFKEAFNEAFTPADQRVDHIARIWIGGLSGETPEVSSVLAPQEKWWCGRGDLNPHDLLGSADFHATSAFAAPPTAASWSGLSLHRSPYGV